MSDEIQKFNLKELELNSKLNIIRKPTTTTGMSTRIRNIMYELRHNIKQHVFPGNITGNLLYD